MKKTPPLSIMFRAQYKVDLDHPPTPDDDLRKFFELRQYLRQLSPQFTEWFLGGNSKDEAFLYSAFDESGPTAAIAAVLREKRRKKNSNFISRSVGLWNGEEGPKGATMGGVYRQVKEPSLVHFETEILDFLTHAKVLGTVQKIIEIWNPLFVSVEPTFYDPVFKDRPGVGWMLYLPRMLNAHQVPEARAMVPVMGKDEKGKDKPLGTIIVSVTDEPFSDENPEHVKIANAIEIRLVDQDLLPRFVDL
jgi:hypothetical protein